MLSATANTITLGCVAPPHAGADNLAVSCDRLASLAVQAWLMGRELIAPQVTAMATALIGAVR